MTREHEDFRSNGFSERGVVQKIGNMARYKK